MGDTSTEHKALIEFAARLGTCVSHEDGIAHELDLQSEAQLLMNLLASNPSTETVIKESLDVAVRPYFDAEPISTMIAPESSFMHCSNSSSNSNSNSSNSPIKGIYESESAFSFSCPSLSLDGKSPPPLQVRSSLPSDSSEDSIPSLTPAPIVSMGRPLVVDDRDALRLSADSMARNILRTFQKAVRWRKQCWIQTLARPLVDEERIMKEAGATDEELKQLLKTPVAMVISSLNQTSIEVLDARTSFRVLPQRWDKQWDEDAPPTKKRKIVADSNIATTQEEGSSTTTHVLSFQTVLNLSSPAGYSQITLDAPGVMEGTFTMSPSGESVLTGVSLEVDTRVLAAMIEKSSRIIARSSAEVFMNPYPEFTDAETGASLMASPHPITAAMMPTTEHPRRLSSSSDDDVDMSLMAPTIITPRMKSPSPSAYYGSDLEFVDNACIPRISLPDDLTAANHKRAILRMVSPQPGSSNSSVELIPSLRIASSNENRNSPSLISPPLSLYSSTDYLSFDVKTGPSLPALVEVACAEMRAH